MWCGESRRNWTSTKRPNDGGVADHLSGSSLGKGPGGQKALVYGFVPSPSSEAPETGRLSLQECYRIGSTTAFERTADWAIQNESRTCMDAQTLFMLISRSSSRIRCTGKHQRGYGSAGHGMYCIPSHALTARMYGGDFSFSANAHHARKNIW